jgi:hypothetical protein
MLTVITDDATREIEGTRVSPAELEELTGWELKPEGLCRGDVCVPTRGRPEVEVDGAVDLAVVAGLLGQPFVVDDEKSVAVLGTSVATRTQQLRDANIRDLVLRDFDGNDVSWSSIGRKKKLLVAWASW